MLRELDLADAELSILLTNDASIRELNREHRGKDKPTDVLAFPLDSHITAARRRGAASNEPSTLAPRLLGDVVISLQTAERQARARKRELLAEVRFLLAHGLLHLIGYDHATASQKHRMDRLTRQLVRACASPGDRLRPSG